VSAREGIRISIIIGSKSDDAVMGGCREALVAFGLGFEQKVLSAHRAPDELKSYVTALAGRGVEVVIAAAGMAAHLPGVVASHTHLPVLGVPLAAGALQGVDALLSISQMPGGVPVGCLGIGSAGGKNAAYLAARILALGDEALRARMAEVLAADRRQALGVSP
jgi:5-(carboxyamino)imidazole ribonucleotide mutase